jgi:hypothetical protein
MCILQLYILLSRIPVEYLMDDTCLSTRNLLLGNGFWAVIINNTPAVCARGMLLFHYVFALLFLTCFGLCLVTVGDIVLYTTQGISADFTFFFSICSYDSESR